MAVSKELMKGTLVPVLLKVLSEKSMHGYEIIKTVNVRTNGAFLLKEGTIYPWLHRLEGEGMVASEWEGAEGTRRKKVYRITRKGLGLLNEKTVEWEAFATAMNHLLFQGA